MTQPHQSTCAVAINWRQEGSCESKTPRTDEAEKYCMAQEIHVYGNNPAVVFAHFARQLETELNDANLKIKQMAKECVRFIAELSEAKNAMELDYLSDNHTHIGMFLKKHGRVK